MDETLIFLDFDMEEPCICYDCDNEAVWLVINSCCNAEFFMCNPHFDEGMEDLRQAPAVYCDFCNHEFSPPIEILKSATRIKP